MRACPYCHTQISDYVIKCAHCDTWLVENPPESDWTKDPEEIARRQRAEAAREAAARAAFASERPDVVAHMMPVVPQGGETLAPVIILPDVAPTAAEADPAPTV